MTAATDVTGGSTRREHRSERRKEKGKELEQKDTRDARDDDVRDGASPAPLEATRRESISCISKGQTLSLTGRTGTRGVGADTRGRRPVHGHQLTDDPITR